jgi:hypothetical protein
MPKYIVLYNNKITDTSVVLNTLNDAFEFIKHDARISGVEICDYQIAVVQEIRNVEIEVKLAPKNKQ